MSKIKLCLLLAVFAVLGYFARPWVDQYIPGRMMKKSTPELGDLYERSAQFENAIRNPVIVVPGMMGSKLEQLSTGRAVWGAFDSKSIDPQNGEDVRLLCCPIEEDVDLSLIHI